MLRFAVVQPGPRAAAIVRVASRLRGGVVSAVVDHDDAAAQSLAKQLGAKVVASSVEQLHQQSGEHFDAWVLVTSDALVVVPHAQRPVETSSEKWLSNPEGWLWGHSYRFLPSVRALKDSLASGKLGAPGLVRIHQWQATGCDLKQALIQQLDVACWLVEQPVSLVFAQRRSIPEAKESTLRDYVQVHLGFEDDRMAVIDCTTSLPAGDDYYSLSVIGSTGAAYADDHHNMQLVFGGSQPRAFRTSQGDFALLTAWQEFIDATDKKRQPLCDGSAWKRAMGLLAAVEGSLTTGQPVTVKDA